MRFNRFSKRLIVVAITLAVAGTVYSQTPIDVLKEKAEGGDANAQIELAKHYTAQEQRALAREQLEKAAQGGSKEAHRLLALDLSKDENRESWESALGHAIVAEDKATNTILGVRAAGRALSAEIAQAIRDQYASDAQELLGAASLAGDADAQWQLGYLNLSGMVSAHNVEGGMLLVLQAAEQNHSVAARYVAHLFAQVAKTGKARPGMGLETAIDVKGEAARQEERFLTIAASAGNALAVAELSKRETSGERMTVERTRILSKLAESVLVEQMQANNNDTLSLGSSLKIGRGTSLLASAGKMSLASAEAAPAASPAAAAPGPDPRAEIAERDARIGVLETDLREARVEIGQLKSQLAQFQHYQAAEQDANAKNDAGLRYYAKGDFENALVNFRKASEYNHPGAIANVAVLYMNGQAVQQDVGQAVKLLERASELGNLVATENLAEMYENGTGVAHNPARAIIWFRRAESMGSVKAGVALRRLGAGNSP